MDLDGRVALVTGGARRVGRAIAERLARAGCRLAVHYHNSETEARDTVLACEAAGREAAAFGADLADGEATRGLIPAVLKQLRINLTAPMVLAHAARQSLRAAHGRIVNILDAGTSRPWAGHLAYCVSKGAMGTLTKAMAKAFAPEVNVTGIAPGIVDWPEEYSPERRARLIESVPLGRAGSASDVAAAVHFLAAEADYVTGAILSIDGGRQIA
jgi:pteridine reductase